MVDDKGTTTFLRNMALAVVYLNYDTLNEHE